MNHLSENLAVELETGLVMDFPLSNQMGRLDASRGSRIDDWLGNRLFRRLRNMKRGDVTILDSKGKSTRLGVPPTLAYHKDSRTEHLSANVEVLRSRFFRRVMMGGSMGAAESYIDGDWETERLTDLIRVMIRNLSHLTMLEKTWARAKGFLDFTSHRFRHNSIAGSRKNILAHYDLGNDFYQLFLDRTMNYSSGIFTRDENESLAIGQEPTALQQASERKMERICQKLQLQPTDHVLEIGTGWGGMAIHMAARHGCRVTTTTISQRQFEYATESVRAAGLKDRVTVLLQDYRQLTGSFDKLVSIEMIEAVGHQYYDCFFAQCQNLLTEKGIMLLQAITMSEQNYQQHIRQVDFIRRYVFPGGCLPSISALQRSVTKKTDLRMLHTEDITAHYVTTLCCWRHKFMQRLSEVRRMGFDERFIRMWHFYLCYCEAAFAERRVHTVHLVYSRPLCEVDPAVDYRLDNK